MAEQTQLPEEWARGGLRTKGCSRRGTRDEPLISVITVSYNRKKELETTIRSVEHQTCRSNVEFIIMDNASTDGSLETLKQCDSQIDLWISAPDKGLYDAMNRAIAIAKGDFALFLNAGDYLCEKESLEVALRSVDCRDKVYFGDTIITNGEVTWRIPPADVDTTKWLDRYYPNHQSIFYPRSFYKKNLYDLSLRVFADTDYTLRAYSACEFKHVNAGIVCFALGGISNRSDDIRTVLSQVKENWLLYNRHKDRYGIWDNMLIPFKCLAKYGVRKLGGEDFYYWLLKTVKNVAFRRYKV